MPREEIGSKEENQTSKGAEEAGILEEDSAVEIEKEGKTDSSKIQ